MDTEHFFHTKLAHGVYQISDPLHGPTDDGRSLLPGRATRNSYLVVGEEKALLFDLALDRKGLRDYAETLAGKPVILVLSHAHVDHIFHIKQERELWLGSEDVDLLRKGMFPIQAPVKKPFDLHPVNDGDTIDLGNRILDVIHIPGHTNGSILLFERDSRILLSGDTCARRLLYGMHGDTPKEEFCGQLEKLKDWNIDRIYSAHDRCPLATEHINLMVSIIREQRTVTKKEAKIPFLGTLVTYEYGNEMTSEYFSFAYKQ